MKRLARTAGVLYLMVALFSVFALIIRGEVREPGGVAANEMLVRVGLVSDLVHNASFILCAMTLYLLLKHVDQHAAAAMVTFVAIAVAIMCANLINHYGALVAAEKGTDAQVLMFLDLQEGGFLIAQVFFALWLAPLGHLAIKSGLFPRALGIVLIAGCVGYLLDLTVKFLAPDLGADLAPFLVAPATVGEVWMVLYLLIKGVRTQPRQPQEQLVG